MIEKEWLEQRYVKDLASVADIAAEAGCGSANIRRYLKKWEIRRGKTAIVGRPAWNTGLTKDNDPRIAKMAEERRGEGNPMFGIPAWNDGLTKETDVRVADVAEKLKGLSPGETTREKMRDAKLGKFGEESNAWRGGVQYSNGYGVNRISVGGKRIYMHRFVAEQILERELDTEEHVHHLDRNKHNNEPANLLVLMTDDHNRLHRAIEAGQSSREQQIAWLKENEIQFKELV